MHSQAIRASSHASLRESSRPAEAQTRGHVRAVWSQKHAARGQQLAVKSSSTTSRVAGRSIGLDVRAEVKKPTLPYDVGGQGGVGVLAPTSEPPSKKVKTQVNSITFDTDTVLLQSVDDEEDRFEIEYSAGKGSTENSYLIKGVKSWGDSCYTLIDIPEGAWADAFAAELKKNLKGKPLSYIVLGHFTPRMTATLAAILNAQPKGSPPCEIWCSNPTIQLITSKLRKGSPGFNPELLAAWKSDGLRARLLRVKTGDTLVINEQRQLEFQLTNTPRWPDGLFAYDTGKQILFSNKFFGAHTKDIRSGMDDRSAKFQECWDLYFDNLVGPCAMQAGMVMNRAAIVPMKKSKTGSFKLETPFGKKVDDLQISFQDRIRTIIFGKDFQKEVPVVEPTKGMAVAVIAPRHGPVIKDSVKTVVDMYKEKLDGLLTKKSEVSVAVIYASAYGNTGIMADAVAFGLRERGLDVKLVDCEFMKASEVSNLVKECDGFAVGSPTLGGHVPTPVQEAIGAILKDIDRDLPYGVFGSYGWSGEAVPAMQNRLKDGGFTSAFAPISLKFKPTDEMVEVCKRSGEDLANEVMRRITDRKIKSRKDMAEKRDALLTDDKTRATGRITTAMAAVTAKINGVDSLMLSPWVSQASFNPPAVTISMPKENSPEGTLLLNAKFTVNILGSGSDKSMVKELLNKGFREGAACFEGIEIERDEDTECAYLTGAASYMNCTVTNRMDCGDHYVLLANINKGKVLSDGATTFFHHRQSAKEY